MEALSPFEIPIIYWAAGFLALLYYVALIFRRRPDKSSLVPLPPGPTGLPVLGSLLSLDPELHTYFASLAKTYGPIYTIKLGSKVGIVISSPDLVREALRDHDVTLANRDVPAVGRIITYGGKDIAWTPIGPTWRMLRRVVVQKMLSPSSLDAVYHLRRQEVRSTVLHLFQSAGKPVDVGANVFQSVMNVITSMLWGGKVEAEEEKKNSLGSEFRELVGNITELLGKPNLSDFFPALEPLDLQINKIRDNFLQQMRVLLRRFDGMFATIIEQRMKAERTGEPKDLLDFMLQLESEGGDSENPFTMTHVKALLMMRVLLRRFDGMFATIIEQRMKAERTGEPKDLLDFMLQLESEGGDSENPFTMTHVKALLMDTVVGGTDTSSNTVEWAMAEMMQKPETMKKAQEELDQIVGKEIIVEESHISKLHYLGAIMKEVLRLHPALPLLVPHCPSSTCTIGGYTIPQGSRVFVNVWAIQRDPSLWKDPSEFRPERFLDESNNFDYKGNDFTYFPFGSGRRICAGIAMAERMGLYTLASLLHNFDWKLPEGTKLELTEKFGIVLKKAKPLVAIPTPRLTNLDLYS